MTLSWQHFDGDRFQRFSNALVWYEVSRRAALFSRPGPDSGVDQFFEGTYDGQQGKWRFQNKFHQSGNSTKDMAAFKQDVLKDIADHYRGEDHLVFTTNINLGPKKLNEIEKAGREALDAKGATGCQLRIWHHATIEPIVSQYPTLQWAFWNMGTTVLQPYEEYFAAQLQPAANEQPYSLTNEFFGRQQDLTALSEFLQHPDCHTMTLISSGGYGKTRLVIEFFKNVLGNNDRWMPAVIRPLGFNPNEFQQLLASKRPLLILLDDAHKAPEITATVKTMVEAAGMHKLILTTRNTLFKIIVRQLASFNRGMLRYALGPLDFESRKAMLARALPYQNDQFISYLSSLSRGVPSLIQALVQLSRKGRQFFQLNVEEEFNNTVTEMLEEATIELARETRLEESLVFDFIRIISLIAPVKQGKDTDNTLAAMLDTTPDKIELLTGAWKNTGLLSIKSGMEIKPDPYGDVVLLQTLKTNPGFITRIKEFPGASEFLGNLLVNLANTEVDDNQAEIFVRAEINLYIGSLFQRSADYHAMCEVFKLVEKIVFRKATYGVQAVNAFVALLSSPDDNEAGPLLQTQPYVYKQMIASISNILVILADNAGLNQTGHGTVLDLVMKFFNLTGEKGILKQCYQYSVYDFPRRTPADRQAQKQTFLTRHVCKILHDKNNPEDLNFAVAAADVLLELELQHNDYFEKQTGKMYFIAGEVPYTAAVKQIRLEVAGCLQQYFLTLTEDHRHFPPVLKILLESIFYASEGSALRHKQNFNEEATQGLDFWLYLLAARPSLTCKTGVWRRLLQFSRRGYLPQYQDKIARLQALCSQTSSNKEALHLLLLKNDHFFLLNEFQGALLTIIHAYSSLQDCVDDFLALRRSESLPMETIGYFYGILTRHYPEEASRLLKQILVNFPHYLQEAVVLFTAEDEDTCLYPVVDKLAVQNLQGNVVLIIDILTRGRKYDTNRYKKKDLSYFNHLQALQTPHANILFVRYILDYLPVDPPLVFDLIDRFLKGTPGEDSVESLVYALTRHNPALATTYRREIVQLFENNPRAIRLEGMAFQYIVEFAGWPYPGRAFDPAAFDGGAMIAMAKLFITYCRKAGAWIDSVFIGERELVSEVISEDCKRNMFFTLVSDFSQLSTQEDIDIYDCLMRYFLPGKIMDVDIEERYRSLVKANESNWPTVLKIVASTSFFAGTDNVIRFKADICESAYQRNRYFTDYYGVFGKSFTINAGMKTGGPDGAMLEDYERKNLLEVIISERKYHTGLLNYLQEVLHRVEQEISEDIDLEKWYKEE